METVSQEGSREVRCKVDFYNLDAIIAVGYRSSKENPVNPVQKHFRQDEHDLQDTNKGQDSRRFLVG